MYPGASSRPLHVGNLFLSLCMNGVPSISFERVVRLHRALSIYLNKELEALERIPPLRA